MSSLLVGSRVTFCSGTGVATEAIRYSQDLHNDLGVPITIALTDASTFFQTAAERPASTALHTQVQNRSLNS